MVTEIVPFNQGSINTLITSNFKPIIERFCAVLDVRESSKSAYGAGLKQFFLWMQAEGVTEPTRETVLRFKDYLGKKVSAATMSGYLTAVRQFFRWTSSLGLYGNAAEGVRGAKKPKGFRRDALTLSSVKTLLGSLPTDTVREKRDFAMLNLMARTGLRSIEVVRANVEDIRQNGGETVLWVQGKGRDAKDDFVVLTEATLKPIFAYLSARGAKDGEPLFTSDSDRNRNGRLTTRTVRRIVKDRLRGIGLISNRLSCHSLRHTAVTLALQAGATVQEAQVFARHANVNTTLGYAHNLRRIEHAPERKIDALLRAD